jgi:carbon monoxide dehydrogenase subunit G
MSKELVVSRDIAAEPEVVWGIVTGLDGWVETLSGLDEVERLDDGDNFRVGTRWRETRTMFGKSATEDMEITELDEGKRYLTFAESHGTQYRSEMMLETIDGGGTRLTTRFSADPQSVAAKIMAVTMGWMFTGTTRKLLEKDHADIGAAAETSS